MQHQNPCLDARNPALILYAFCRLADDAIDNSESKYKSYRKLNRRLDLDTVVNPDTPYDRAFAG